MLIKAVVFDIGGVLEYTPDLGVKEAWAKRLGMSDEVFNGRIAPIWKAGSIGTITEEEVHHKLETALEIDAETVNAFMHDIWHEYLGTANQPLINYFVSLKERVQTAIISNSFVGARKREEALYRFHEICQFIVYSHEVGVAKPDHGIFEIACQRLNCKPEEVVFLDNLESYVAGAASFGINAVLFQNNAQAIQEIEALLI